LLFFDEVIYDLLVGNNNSTMTMYYYLCFVGGFYEKMLTLRKRDSGNGN